MDKRRWEEIQATFDTLVELDVHERGSRLTALGSTDPELRAAVESLLAADSEADARLAPLEAAFLPDFAPVPDPLGLAGRTISHFKVHEVIGAGGMGVVYGAEDAHLGRAVALKFLLPSYNLDAPAKARFLREAHSAAALDHPNLCTIHEIGATDDGRLFFAMALYSGETLKARLARDGTVPLSEIREIARQVAEGLESAHSAGIVHRDLKPANVMLLPDGGIRILDFGLAKARDQSLSATGARFGTVSYMSPEQIRGASVDARADLWALGVVIYEMLTGRKPFLGEEEVAVAHAILHDKPILPSTMRGDLSAALEDLVLKLLQKDPAKRYASASELLADLAQVHPAAQGTSGSLRARWRRAWRTSHPQRRWMIAAFGAVLALGGALGYTTISRNRGSDPALGPRTAIAVLPFRNLNAQGRYNDFAGGLHHEIVTQLYQLPALKVIGRESVRGYTGSDLPPLRRIATELGVRTIMQGSVQEGPRGLRVHVKVIDASTNAQLWAHTYDRAAEEAFAIQIDIVRRIAAAVGAPLNDAVSRGLAEAPTRSGDAYRLYLRARDVLSQNFIPGIEFARLLLDSAIKFDSGFALAHAARSEAFGLFYQLIRPRFPDHGQRQVEEAEIALRLAPHLPQAHLAMARAHYSVRRDHQRALDEFATALKGLRNDPVVWVDFGMAHRSAGNWDDAIAALQKASEFLPDPYLPRFLLGPTLACMRRYAEAARAFDQSYEAVAPDIADNYMSGIEKGRTYVLWRGELDTLRAALDRTPDHGHWGLRRAMEYARLLSWERRPDSVLAVLAAHRGVPVAFASPVRTGGGGYDDMMRAGWPVALTAAWAHQLRGDRRAAHAAFESALAMMDTIIVMERADDGGGLFHAARGLALAALGRHREALRDARWLQDLERDRHDAFLASDLRESRARIYAHLGDADRALDEIERLLAGPSLVSVHTLRLDPIWDPIREHPRFRALLAKYRT